MKCNRIAIYGWKSSAALKRNPSKFVVLGSIKNKEDLNLYTKHSNLFSHLNFCKGEIISQIKLEYTPYMGGTDVEIEVRFECNKCYHNYGFDDNLPYDIDSLNKFLTERIKEM